MAKGRDFIAEAKRIVADVDRAASEALGVGRLDEAKRALADGIRDLRDLKREVTEAERETRLAFQDARLKARQTGQTVGMFMGSKARGAMGRGRAAAGRDISAKEQEASRHYAGLKSAIDAAIAGLDRERARVMDEIARTKASASQSAPRRAAAAAPAEPTPPPQPAPVAPTPPPHWAADPYGRHQHRWWDGSRWSDAVADNGVQATDPL